MTDAAEELDRIASTAHLLVALDFDGTVSPLVDEPMSARMLPAARAALDALAALPDTTVALVSGRTLTDLKIISEYEPSSALLLAGSHGAELWDPETDAGALANDDTDDERVRDELIAAAESAVAGLEGAWIERKAFGLGLHTRTASAEDTAVAVERVSALLAERAPQWRRRDGRDILEFAFRHEGKDSAVAALRSRVGATAVLFAGDDVTDEDAIASLGPDDLGVRVGGGASAARVRAVDAAEFAELLAVLAERRAAHLSA
jgi:trehalose 6-phosphate phosphatase